jgi:hypothetical protein
MRGEAMSFLFSNIMNMLRGLFYHSRPPETNAKNPRAARKVCKGRFLIFMAFIARYEKQ